jgi:hypothetical protein
VSKWSKEEKALRDRRYNAKQALKDATQALEDATQAREKAEAAQPVSEQRTAKKAQTRAMTQKAWAGKEVEESDKNFKEFKKKDNTRQVEKFLTAVANGLTGGAVSIRNRTDELLDQVPNPKRIQPLIDEAHADAQARIEAALDDNTYLKAGAYPTPPAEPGAAGNTAGAARGGQRVDTSPMMTNQRGYRSLDGLTALGANGHASNAQIAAAEAQTRQIEYDRTRREYDDALTLKLQSMEFEARSRAAQLAADIQNLSPENQRIKAGAFIESLLSSPATSPMAAVDPREKAARYNILNGVQQHLLSEVQRNSMERQKSRALADMDTGLAAVMKNAREGKMYEKEPIQAYLDAAGRVNAAAKYMSPRQYNAQVIEAYDGVAGAMAEAALNKVFKESAGEPVYNWDPYINVHAGYGGGAIKMGALLGGGDGVALLTDRAGLISEKVEKAVNDYNRGLLDSAEARRVTALEAGKSAEAQYIRAQWLPKMTEMGESGSISSRDAYATRNYFRDVQRGGAADGSDRSLAIAAQVKSWMPAVEAWTNGIAEDASGGRSPSEVMKIITETIIEEGVTDPDGRRWTDERIKSAVETEFITQIVNNKEKGGDDWMFVVGQMNEGIAAFNAVAKDYATTNNLGTDIEKTLAEQLYNLNYNMKVMAVKSAENPKQLKEDLNKLEASTLRDALFLFDINNEKALTPNKNGTLPNKISTKELAGAFTAYEKYGAVFRDNAATDDTYQYMLGALYDKIREKREARDELWEGGIETRTVDGLNEIGKTKIFENIDGQILMKSEDNKRGVQLIIEDGKKIRLQAVEIERDTDGTKTGIKDGIILKPVSGTGIKL